MDTDPIEVHARVTALRQQIASHPATAAHARWTALVRSVTVFGGNLLELQNLLDAPYDDHLLAIELVQNVEPRSERATTFDEEVDRLFHNFVASAASLIDHARRAVAPYEGTDFYEQYESRRAAVADAPLAGFVRDLRNYLLHVEIPALGYRMAWKRGEAALTEIVVPKERLLLWRGWKSPAKQYLRDAAPNINLGDVVRMYGRQIRELYGWLIPKFESLHGSELAEVNELIGQERQLLGLEP